MTNHSGSDRKSRMVLASHGADFFDHHDLKVIEFACRDLIRFLAFLWTFNELLWGLLDHAVLELSSSMMSRLSSSLSRLALWGVLRSSSPMVSPFCY